MILAIDPGIHGALALYNGEALAIRDMPTFSRPAGARGKPRLFMDEAAVVNMLVPRLQIIRWILLEQVGGIPGQAAHSAFVFGRGCGVIVGAALALGIRIEEVPPARWKGAMGCPSDKSKARDRASELLPAWSNLWPLKKHDGRAEAAMLALYGWQTKGAL